MMFISLFGFIKFFCFQSRDRQFWMATAAELLGRGRAGAPLRLGGRQRQGGQDLLCQVSGFVSLSFSLFPFIFSLSFFILPFGWQAANDKESRTYYVK